MVRYSVYPESVSGLPLSHAFFPQEFRCDSRVDCLDGSDEAECAVVRTTAVPLPSSTAPAAAEGECLSPAVRCDDGTRCVPLLQLCDGVADCQDGADEADRCGERAETSVCLAHSPDPSLVSEAARLIM